MSSQNADIPEQSAPETIGENSRPEWPPIPDDRPDAEPTGPTAADSAAGADDVSDAPAGADGEVKKVKEAEEILVDFRDLFEQGNSIVAALPAESRDPRYTDEACVAIFQGVKDGRTVYFKIVHASLVDV